MARLAAILVIKMFQFAPYPANRAAPLMSVEMRAYTHVVSIVNVRKLVLVEHNPLLDT